MKKLSTALAVGAALALGAIGLDQSISYYKSITDKEAIVFIDKSNNHYREMYHKLALQTGQEVPQFIIVEDDIINAYTTDNAIIITSGLINYVKNDNEMALIVGHELAHYVSKHLQHRQEASEAGVYNLYSLNVVREDELNSDKLGAMFALQAGYDVCEGRQIWLRMKQSFGDTVDISTHPSDIFRFTNLRMPWCDKAENL